jgi:hypothetical protein
MTTVRSIEGQSTEYLDEVGVEEDEMMRSDIFEVRGRPRPGPEEPRWWLMGSSHVLVGSTDVTDMFDPDWHDGWGPVRLRQRPLE